MPAAAIAERIRDLLTEALEVSTATNTSVKKTEARLNTLLEEVSVKKLTAAGLLPGLLPSPFGGSAGAPPEQYKAYLEERSNAVSGIGVLIEKGMKLVELHVSTTGDKTFLKEIDSLDTAAFAVTDVAAADVIITDLIKRIPPLPPSITAVQDFSKAVFHAALPSPLPTVREIRATIDRISFATWFIWGVLTWVVGFVVLILGNYAFGTGLDLAACFFWGLGVQVAGNQMQQLTPGSVTSTLNITMPKAA